MQETQHTQQTATRKAQNQDKKTAAFNLLFKYKFEIQMRFHMTELKTSID